MVIIKKNYFSEKLFVIFEFYEENYTEKVYLKLNLAQSTKKEKSSLIVDSYFFEGLYFQEFFFVYFYKIPNLYIFGCVSFHFKFCTGLPLEFSFMIV